jgi:trans-aconitate methyltransferase
MPLSHGEPSHQLMRELPGPWRERLNEVTSVAAIPAPEVYYDWLAPHACHIDRAYPPRIDGRRLYSFPRTFMAVVKHSTLAVPARVIRLTRPQSKDCG